jgi:DNA-nicking Smr family endonuclease
MKKPRHPHAGDKDADEDAALWEYVIRSVRAYNHKVSGSTTEEPAGNAPPPRRPAKSAKPATKPVPPPAPPQLPGAGFDRATALKLKKGRLPVEARLDLHGMGQAEAFDALGSFIRRAHDAGARTVLVITGKGRISTGVLRRLVPLWLSEGVLGNIVIGTAAATPKDGGEGALYVRLKKPKPR